VRRERPSGSCSGSNPVVRRRDHRLMAQAPFGAKKQMALTNRSPRTTSYVITSHRSERRLRCITLFAMAVRLCSCSIRLDGARARSFVQVDRTIPRCSMHEGWIGFHPEGIQDIKRARINVFLKLVWLNALLTAIPTACAWQDRLESGEFDDMEVIAKANGVDRSYVGRMLQLTSLAPAKRVVSRK
jgi:hypothetical protein